MKVIYSGCASGHFNFSGPEKLEVSVDKRLDEEQCHTG